ncbi:MAG TPA: hypothetical protein VNG51_03290 [Ktedonobacteraceae bacterium]|nr:hypothetical protein [Ktedonobacteraceae bacterium]
MSSQSPYRAPESPQWQNQPQVDTSTTNDQYPPSAPTAGIPQQPAASPEASRAIPADSVATPPPYTPPHTGKQWKMPKRWRLFALIALIILLVGGSASLLIPWLPTVLSAATATVAVTPASQHLTKSYTISAVTGTPSTSDNQVQARLLSFTTKAQSKTVKATGSGHQEATTAKGKVTITPTSGTIPASNINVTSNSGVEIYFSVNQPLSSGSHTLDAWATNAGAGGNIPAYDIDGSYHLVTDTNVHFYIQNTQAFSGGQNASDYTFLQQSDIDGAAAPLVTQLTSDAEASVQQQVRANEQFVSDPVYTPTIKTNHKAGDKVADVTVTVTVTGKEEVYDQQATDSIATDLLGSDAASQPGTRYTLIGEVVTGTPEVSNTDEHGTVTMLVSAEGIWVYQFSNTQKQQMAQLITGKPLADAQALLLKQEGVKKVSINTTGGWGHALPTSASDIKFTPVAVPGL